MSQKYLRELVQIAQEELPLLNNDLQNASTLYALQAATQRLFNLTSYVLHHVIHAAYETNASQGAGQPAPLAVAAPVVAPAPAAVLPQHIPAPTNAPFLPPPPMISQPSIAPTQVAGMPELTIQPGVANVVITAQGTRVIAPSGAATTLPANTPVGLSATMGQPELPPAPPGVANVVLPPGGVMTAEAQAALAAAVTPQG